MNNVQEWKICHIREKSNGDKMGIILDQRIIFIPENEIKALVRMNQVN